MNFDEYAAQARKTAIYPRMRLIVGDTNNIEDAVEVPWLYPALLMGAESGEVLSHFSKIVRDDGGRITPERQKKIELEMGDALWSMPELARAIGTTLYGVAIANIGKLASRAARGVLQGSGDNR